MYRISSHIVGDNLKGEVAPFTFPLPSGGDEIKGACLVYIPHLEDKVVHFLNETGESPKVYYVFYAYRGHFARRDVLFNLHPIACNTVI